MEEDSKRIVHAQSLVTFTTIIHPGEYFTSTRHDIGVLSGKKSIRSNIKHMSTLQWRPLHSIAPMHCHTPYTVANMHCDTPLHHYTPFISTVLILFTKHRPTVLIHLVRACPGPHRQPYYWYILLWHVQFTTVSPILSLNVFL